MEFLHHDTDTASLFVSPSDNADKIYLVNETNLMNFGYINHITSPSS